MSLDNKFQVIIVGAGLSGLSAAKWLHESGVSVAVLEARDRVGGRTFTKRDPNVKYVDLGASYVGPTQNHLLRLSKELGIETYKINEKEALVYYSEKYGRRLYSKKMFPRFWNPLKNMDMNHFFTTLDELGKEIPVDAPWKAPHAEEWDKISVKEYGEKHFWTNTTKECMSELCSAFVANDAYESSFLWFLWYIKQCNGAKRIFSTTNGGQERKFIGGTQQISEKITAKLKDKVLLNKAVCSIDQTLKTVIVRTTDGFVYKADHIILAVPPILHLKIHFRPSLPPLRNQLIQRAPMGSVFKVFVYYKRPFWREKGLCGSAMIMGSEEHPLCFCFDDTKPDGSYPAICGFIVGDKARRLTDSSSEERKNLVAKSLEKVFNSKEALEVIHFVEHNWLQEQYSGGCYTATCPPGFLTMYGKVLREPVDKIYFAGTETSTEWSGYMEGAVAAGERAAREILCTLGKIPKSEIWIEEPESEDVPALPFPRDSIFQRIQPTVTGFFKTLGFSSVCLALGAGAYIHHKYVRL